MRAATYTVGAPSAMILGRRIQVMGSSCSGKSTLAAALAGALDAPLVELDALNWRPNWIGLNDVDPEEFLRLVIEATRGDAWVVAGSYSQFSRRAFWDRVETVILLDLPMPLLITRLLVRSWRRWRTKELLWGTNYESFWRQLRVWSPDSLLWWVVVHHSRKRRAFEAWRQDPSCGHIQFIRLVSSTEVRELEEAADRSRHHGSNP